MNEEEKQAFLELRDWCRKHHAAILERDGKLQIVMRDSYFRFDIIAWDLSAVERIDLLLFDLPEPTA